MGSRVLDLEKRVLVDPANGQEEALTASEFDLLRVMLSTLSEALATCSCRRRTNPKIVL